MESRNTLDPGHHQGGGHLCHSSRTSEPASSAVREVQPVGGFIDEATGVSCCWLGAIVRKDITHRIGTAGWMVVREGIDKQRCIGKREVSDTCTASQVECS